MARDSILLRCVLFLVNIFHSSSHRTSSDETEWRVKDLYKVVETSDGRGHQRGL